MPVAGVLKRLAWLEQAVRRLQKRTTVGGGGVPPSAHASNHSDGASDEVDVTDLGGFPGGTTDFLRADGTFAAPGAGGKGTVGAILQTAGDLAWIEVPYSGTITAWRIIGMNAGGASTSGSAEVDVWKDTYANFPPTVADTIAGSELPTLSSQAKNEDTSLSTWTTSVAEGDWIGFKLNSISTISKVQVQLTITKS